MGTIGEKSVQECFFIEHSTMKFVLEDNKTSGQFHSVIFSIGFLSLQKRPVRQCQITHGSSCERVASNFSIYNAQILKDEILDQ